MNVPRSIIDRLPHRDPFRFLSGVHEFTPGVGASGIWRVTGSEDFFRGHFPGRPVIPGVLLIEALAQLAGVVAAGDSAGPRAGRLAHADVRFDASISPPAEVLLSATLVRTLGNLSQFDVVASTAAARAARGTVTVAIDPASAGGGS